MSDEATAVPPANPDQAIVADVEKAIPPAARLWFLAAGGVFIAAVALITYVAALTGNRQAQIYLTSVAPAVVTFVVGWLGVRSPFLA